VTAAIEVRGVSKTFRLYHEKYQSLKERVIHLGSPPSEEFHALKGIDLTVEQGETIGLLGHNGSGKSTLLKCIAGIIRPTRGEIRTVGRMAAMLELGTGFHPDLTGRDNVYMNASVLGLTRRDIDARFDEIVAFAELEQFIDQQVKHYSSGMYVRLGFAVAVHMEPDILLVDEVLAVGDEAFQQKCIGRIRQFQAEGRTIVFVTHSADLVPQICDRGAVLDHGELVMVGAPGEAVRSLRERLFTLQDETEAGEQPDLGFTPANRMRVRGVTVDHPGVPGRDYLITGEPLTVRIAYETDPPDALVDDVVFNLGIYDDGGEQLFGTSTEVLDLGTWAFQGRGAVVFSIREVPFLDGRYSVTVKVADRHTGAVYDWRSQDLVFEVANPGRTTGRVWLPTDVVVEAERVTEEAAQ
jgi:ABC-2 type transport system ATP-binding protein